MYQSCLTCHGSLGSNTVLEYSAIGRQLAFDSTTGRLWIICPRCQTWNLTPELERWEAVEECVKCFEGSGRRYATDHIGLAELSGGIRLIRIAGPPMREFAAWRYGRRWMTRRYRSTVHTSLAGLTVAGSLALGGGLALGASSIALGGYLALMFTSYFRPRTARLLTRVPLDEKESYEVARSDLRYLRVLRQGNGEWALDTQAGTVFSGATLPQALSLVLPFMGRWSGSEEHQRGAVQLIQNAGGSEGYIAGLHRRNLETLWSWTRSERLALEMASNEDVERRALEGELRLLLAAWREAEELARIVDGLLVPLPIEERLRQLKVLSASGLGGQGDGAGGFRITER